MKEFNFGNAGGLQSTASLEIKTLHRLLQGMSSKISEQLFWKNVSETAPGHTIKITHFQKVEETFVGREF